MSMKVRLAPAVDFYWSSAPLRASVLASALALLMGTSACAPSSSLRRTYDVYQQLSAAKREYPVARAEIDGQPFAVLGAQVTNGLKGLLVLREQREGIDLWRADNNVLVATRQGRIVRSIGFPQDQRNASLLQGFDPLGKPMDRSRHYHFVQLVDRAPDYYGLTAQHELQFVAAENLELHHKPIALDHWRETVVVKDLKAKWRQDFWVDAQTGEVWRSVQRLGDETDLTLEVLKPAPLAAPNTP